MTMPRRQLAEVAGTRYYHCISRRVRRAFLCGEDALTGRNFDHRKAWLEQRLLALAETLSLSVLAYAVMSNHLHVVVHVDPARAAGWSDEEVAKRWVRLFPARVDGVIDEEACRRKAWVLSGNADRLQVLRQRLGDLAWFMRCLAEPLARLANAEDRCSGRFWEGRYRCQALLDDAAVLACMTYVDLNPIRAGVADDLPQSLHTSAHRRLAAGHDRADEPLAAVAGPPCLGFLPLSGRQYLELVDWAGRQLHPGKRGRISHHAPCPVPELRDPAIILSHARGIESRYCRAIGSPQALRAKAQAMGQRWLMIRRTGRAVA